MPDTLQKAEILTVAQLSSGANTKKKLRKSTLAGSEVLQRADVERGGGANGVSLCCVVVLCTCRN